MSFTTAALVAGLLCLLAIIIGAIGYGKHERFYHELLWGAVALTVAGAAFLIVAFTIASLQPPGL